MEKYVAYYAADNEFEFFETFEKAKEWLIDYDHQDGFAEETEKGQNFIAKITHISKVNVTAKKEDYHVHTEECPNDCDEEEWPYSEDWSYIGEVEYVPLEE